MPNLKPELSERNKYWIPKHRYYELKHYCLQYPDWKELYAKMDARLQANDISQEIGNGAPAKPTERWAIIRADCTKAMELVEKTCDEASPELGKFIFKAVTEGIPFIQLQTMYDIPCGKDLYYDQYRKFFYLLSQKRGI